MLNFKSQIVTSFNENCYVIWCDKSKEAALVDPGGEPKKISQLIKPLNISITKILLTHGHIDHVGSAIFFSKLYNIPVIGPHIFDHFLLKNLFSQSRLFNISPAVNPFLPNQWLKDNDLIILGSIVLEVIYCPGHSPGHIAFWNAAKRCLISGDILFESSIGRTDLLGGDEKKIKYSLVQKIFPLFNKDNRDVTVLPGHGKKFLINQKYIHFIFKTYFSGV
ncbi:MAG: MBL fold metallo-hydrolase [Wigglesworthia glossinidia]|nr:MBL fold metallo-hydrolase [Wigglesworthia glossinidia]